MDTPSASGARRARVPRLHLITNRTLCRDRSQTAIVAESAAAGVGAVQLREKDLDLPALVHEAAALLAVLGATPLIVNGSPAVALSVGAAGVHLPGTDGSIDAARELLGAAALIGRSVHSVEEALAAAAEGADYLILGTIFATASKPGRAPAGLALVRDVAAATTVPIIAIGGIDRTNTPAVIGAGAWGIATMSGILAAPDPAHAARELVAAIEGEG
jgi:thiamine-phosphate pyrophosphorylase